MSDLILIGISYSFEAQSFTGTGGGGGGGSQSALLFLNNGKQGSKEIRACDGRWKRRASKRENLIFSILTCGLVLYMYLC